MFILLGSVNLFVALFNFIPLLPLDGGHIAGALYEALSGSPGCSADGSGRRRHGRRCSPSRTRWAG